MRYARDAGRVCPNLSNFASDSCCAIASASFTSAVSCWPSSAAPRKNASAWRATGAELRLERARQDAQQQLVQEQLWSSSNVLRAQARSEDEERRREAAVKERLRQLKLEAARERLQDTLSPLEEGARSSTRRCRGGGRHP